jgi:hypothetical protein
MQKQIEAYKLYWHIDQLEGLLKGLPVGRIENLETRGALLELQRKVYRVRTLFDKMMPDHGEYNGTLSDELNELIETKLKTLYENESTTQSTI